MRPCPACRRRCSWPRPPPSPPPKTCPSLRHRSDRSEWSAIASPRTESNEVHFLDVCVLRCGRLDKIKRLILAYRVVICTKGNKPISTQITFSFMLLVPWYKIHIQDTIWEPNLGCLLPDSPWIWRMLSSHLHSDCKGPFPQTETVHVPPLPKPSWNSHPFCTCWSRALM